MKGRSYSCIWIFVALVIFVTFRAACGLLNSSPSYPQKSITTSESTPLLRTGEYGILDLGVDSPVWVFTTVDDMKEFDRLISVDDQLGAAKQTLEGKSILVDRRTKVLKIGAGFYGAEVRIYEGKYIGESGWVKSRWLKPLPDENGS